MSKGKAVQHWRVGKAEQEGRQAFLCGDKPDCTVYTVAELRIAWYRGYYAQHVEHHLGHILAKYPDKV